ncbi:hypothetical protein ACP70R_015087 [Stipagrostis hirtigluma subsp. patula]
MEDAIATFPFLADSAGSAGALGLFRRPASQTGLRNLMRLYVGQ